MKVLLCLCALVVAALAGAPSNEYLPPHHGAASAPEPVFQSAPAPEPVAAPVEVAPAPSFQSFAVAPAPAPVQTYQAAASEPEPAHTFSSDDGYRYKTHRRVVYRQRRRRDVSHLPSSEYLPPHQGAASAPLPSNEYLPPHHAATVQVEQYAEPEYAPAESAPAHTFSSDDGYRYKTQRRRVFRRRYRS